MADILGSLEKVVAQRELERMKQEEFDRPEPVETGPSPKPLGPKAALLLGSLADSASTYAFLKQGGQHEANPALQYFNGRPWSVIPTAVAGAAGYNALHGLIKRKSPQMANTLAGLLGGYHTALAGSNIKGDGSSYRNAVDNLQLPLKRR